MTDCSHEGISKMYNYSVPALIATVGTVYVSVGMSVTGLVARQIKPERCLGQGAHTVITLIRATRKVFVNAGGWVNVCV